MREKFDEGKRTGRKMTPEKIAELMRNARTENGRKMFTAGQFLTTK